MIRLAFSRKTRRRKNAQSAERTAQSAWRKASEYLPEAKDVCLFGGVSAIGFGLWQIYWPSALIALGGIFLAIGLYAYAGTRTGPRD